MPVYLVIPDRNARRGRRRREAPAAVARQDCQVLEMHASMLMNDFMFCETHDVRRHAVWAEADASVVRYKLQPDPVSWVDGDGLHSHYPHMEIGFDDGRTELHEVQPLETLADQDRDACIERAALLSGLLAEHGVTYRLIDSTSESFRITSAAAVEAVSASCQALPDGLAEQVQAIMRRDGPTTFGELQALVPWASRRDLLGLAPRRQLHIDLSDGPVFSLTPIRRVSDLHFPARS